MHHLPLHSLFKSMMIFDTQNTLAHTQNVIRSCYIYLFIFFLLLSSVAIQQLALKTAHNAIKSILSKAHTYSLGILFYPNSAVSAGIGAKSAPFGHSDIRRFFLFGSLKLT